MLTYIKEIIAFMGFTPIDGKANLWHKRYCDGKYELIVDLGNKVYQKCTIDYGNKIQYDRKTTCNFSDQENIVVLECINRLLDKGYKPERIILEKKWKLGHKEKGHLDILVLDDNFKSFMMIECKTWGLKYNQEKKKMLEDGGQLFSYYTKEPSTQYLVLYSSRLENNKIDYKNDIVEIDNSFSQLNEKEIYEKWDKVFETKGVFEQQIAPYKIKFTGIIKSELNNLEADDGKYIFGRFISVLRQHTVSDKTNAFNKIFNLFLCKIVDEDSKFGENEEMAFQWGEKENNKEVLMRLNDLYKEGMKRYLKMDISDYTEKEIDKRLSVLDSSKHDELKEMITELRLYKNNEFAFKEVFDEKSFDENCIIVKEVVKLLERYKIKYTTKQQFLGDFFERLLNTGIKQEAGQFFTPIPIARFICSSIPLEDIIKEKIQNREADFLPYVIDFASGSGHFLTEVMDFVNALLMNLSTVGFTNLMQDNLKKYKISYNEWAKEFVYGIEKDYRLAKTSKVSCFLNGDGEANVICCDGLDNFYFSKEFEGLLKTKKETKDNQVFDVIIANPPYSVDDFKYTLKNANTSFDLFNKLTNDSKEIECLFLERAKQLLKEGGLAGIILPTTLLYNNKIYVATRDILLKYFEIKGIVELGSNTFMATGKNTSIFFLKRRNNKQWLYVQDNINSFFENHIDITSNGIENVFSKYVKDTYDCSLMDYISFISGKPNKNFIKHPYFIDFIEYFENLTEIKKLKERGELTEQEYKTRLYENVVLVEKQKLLYFILTYGKKVVCANTGEKNAEKEFLGYKFSDREGNEGIEIFKDDNGKIDSKLYSEYSIDDTNKVNSYILRNYRNLPIDNISRELYNRIKIQTLDSMLIFNNVEFTNAIYTTKTKQIASKWNKDKLSKVCLETEDIDAGKTAPQNKKYFKNGTIPFIRANNLNFLDENYFVIPQEDSLINELATKECEMKKFKAGTILFAKSGAATKTSKIAMLKKDAYVVNHLACIYIKDEILRLYVFHLLKYYKTANFIPIGTDYPSINIKDIRNFHIPIPPNATIKKIVNDIQKIDTKLNKTIREQKEESIMSKYL